MTVNSHPFQRRLRAQDGFTMIIAIGVMFVTSLLLVAAFTVANGEISASHTDVTQKQAYYAALAGVQEYEYQLQANPNYWQTCEGPSGTVPEEGTAKAETYAVTVLVASSAPKSITSCSKTSPFSSTIESKGSLANTFRIESKGTSGKESRTVIATFKVNGFLDYIYYTNFETEDPTLYPAGPSCAGKYYSEWHPKNLPCEVITFSSGDEVNGPFHTNDSARVQGTATFGRTGQSAPDAVEINGGTYPEDENFKCTGKPIFLTSNKCYEKGEQLEPPPNDTSLAAYVKSADEFSGLTRLVLNGTANTIAVVNYNSSGEKVEKTISWPENGLIYVESRGCPYIFKVYHSDNTEEAEKETECGTVYVSGTYSKSLTIGAANNVVINGSIYPTSVAGNLGAEPTGTATLGLIASEYVRIYHPVTQTYTTSGSKCNTYTIENEEGRYETKEDPNLGGKKCEYTNSLEYCDASNENASEDPNKWGAMTSPWIYAAILSTSHSFLVDNFRCGSQLKNLNVYGAIGQDYRGIVGLIGTSGYIKNYEYDNRLATDEPPYFLAPLKAGWKVIRETATAAG